MTSSYLVVTVGLVTLMALSTIAAIFFDQMNYSSSVQQALQLENIKNQENLVMIIQNDVLEVQNNALNPITILEFRSIDKNTNMIDKIEYDVFPLVISSINKRLIPADFTEDTFSDKRVMALTSLGNVFTAVSMDDLSMIDARNHDGNGTAMINGMGLNSRIIQFDYFGKLLHGQGIVGDEDSLKPYTSVLSTNNYAAELLSTDSKITLPIPQFNAEYRYDDGNLQLESSTIPNILSYSQSRTVEGNGISTQTPNGIVFSGIGKIMVKLNDLGAQTLRLDGTIPNGGKLRLVEKLGTADLMTAPYDDVYGFDVKTGTVYASGGGSPVPQYPCYRYQNGYTTQLWYGSWSMSDSSLTIPLIVSSLSNLSVIPGFTISGTQNSNSYTVTSASLSNSFSGVCSSGAPGPTYGTGTPISYYDKNPVIDVLTYTASFVANTIQTTVGKQYYLIAEPNGGTITILGSAYNPSLPYLQITNLPSNIPYEIVSDGYVTASGMAPIDGQLTLLLNDVDITRTTEISTVNTLYLYPNSLAYNGVFSTVVFDNVNRQTIHIPTPDDKIYVVYSYVQIPVTGDITVTNVSLNGGIVGTSLGSLPLSYMNRNYTNGDLIKVPVIPGYLDICMDINGVLTTTVISNVLGGTGIKVANPATQTISDQDTDSVLMFVESTVGTVAQAIATSDGNITANILGTISGSASLTNTVTFSTIPPQPPPPIRKDPLTGWVDVYKNGVLVKSIQLFFNDHPTFMSSNIVSGSSQVQTVSYSYIQTTITGTVVTSVVPGDMIEYYLYAKIHADGIPLESPSGQVISTITSQGIATATIHSGNVNTSN